MRKHFQIIAKSILFVAILTMLAACGNEAAKRLELADSIMEENPDSALTIIESIDTASLTRERDIHLHNLLIAQASDKLDLKNVDTVRLARAQRFFENHSEKDYRLRSNFYLGRFSMIDSLFMPASQYAADAFLEARDRKNSYWTAKSAELISFIIYACGNKKESYKFDSIACAEYAKSGKYLNSIYSGIDMAITLGSLQRYREADAGFDKAIKKLKDSFPSNSNALIYAIKPAVLTKIMRNDYSGARDLFRMLLEFNNGELKTAQELSYASIFAIKDGKLQYASDLLEKAEGMAKNNYEKLLFAIAKRDLARSVNDLSSLAEAESKIVTVLSDIESFNNDNPVGAALYEKIHNHNLKQTTHYRFLAFYLVIIFIILLPIVIYILYRLHIHKKKRMETIKEIEELERKLDESDINYTELLKRLNRKTVENNSLKEDKRKYSRKLSNTIKDNTTIHNILLETLNDFNGSMQNDFSRAKDMKVRAQKCLTPEYVETLASAIEFINQDTIDKFREQFPSIGVANIQYFILATGKLSVPAISFLLNEKTSTVYSRRERIIDVIKSSTAPDKELFLLVLKKQKKGKGK